MFKHFKVYGLAALLILLLSTGFVKADDGIMRPQQQGAARYLLEIAQETGSVRVMVGLNIPFRPEPRLSAQAAQSQRRSIANAQEALVRSLPSAAASSVQRFRVIPYLALTVNEAGLRGLMNSPQVSSITEDYLYKPLLAESTAIVHAPQAWQMGYDGTGQVVAVLDSGVQTSHPFLVGKVLAEACFSYTGYLGQTYVNSNCPDQSDEQIGPGSAAPCTGLGCFHGTHVSGVVAGNTTDFKGVAPGADLLAVQVTSNPDACGFLTACGITALSSLVRGLEWVYEQRNSYNIAAVNLSLGSAIVFSRVCDGFAPGQDAMIDTLRAAGIVTIAGSGNGDPFGNGYSTGISSPACASNVVSVGAVNDNDGIATFSNSVSFLDLLAPGVSIVSSVPGSIYESQNGTSFSGPHVAGAWAILRQADPDASIEQILTALKTSGPMVNDNRNGVMTPRLLIDSAITILQGGVPQVYDLVINEVRTESVPAIELYNRGTQAAQVGSWTLKIYSGTNLEHSYTIPQGVSLNSGAYLTLLRGTGTNTATTLYMGNYATSWAVGASGAVALSNPAIGIDFVRWGSATVSAPFGTAFTGINPAAPGSGKTLGRDALSADYHDAADWTTQSPTLGQQNQVVAPANDDFAAANLITTLPDETTVNVRTASTQSAEPIPSCAQQLSNSVWYRHTPAEAGVLNVSSLGSDFDSLLAIYSGSWGSLSEHGCDDDSAGDGFSASLSVYLQAGVTYHIMAGRHYGEAGGILHLNFAGTIDHDDFDGAREILNLPYNDTADTTSATVANDDPLPGCMDANRETVWYRITPSQTLDVEISTANSDFDTVLSLWTGSRGDLTQLACHDDVGFFTDFTSVIEATLQAGTTYHILVGGGGFGSSGNLVFSVSQIGSAPTHTPTATATGTSTATPTATATATATSTATSTPTATPTFTATATSTPAATDEPVVEIMRIYPAPGATVDTVPLYPQWQHQTALSWYRVKVTNPLGQVFEKWYSAANVCDNQVCTMPDALKTLLDGEYLWEMQGWGGAYGSTDTTTFTLDAGAVHLSPNGETVYAATGIEWAAHPDAQWYRILLLSPNGFRLDTWFDGREGSVNSVCADGLCRVVLKALKNGNYNWWMQGWGSSIGYLPWNNSTFQLNAPPVTAITGILPADGATVAAGAVTLSWDHQAAASWYQIIVKRKSDQTVAHQQWYFAPDINCNSGLCSVTVNLPPGAYLWWRRGWGPYGMGPGLDSPPAELTAQ